LATIAFLVSFLLPFASALCGVAMPFVLVTWYGLEAYEACMRLVAFGRRKIYEFQVAKDAKDPRRILLARQISVPREWGDDFVDAPPNASDTSPGKLVKLPLSHPEAKRAVAEYTRTGGKGSVRAVYQVRNSELWWRYKTNLSHMSPNTQEKWVWHGAPKTSAEGIIGNGPKSSGGFDWRFCGAHGTVYGRGAYFALNASYSCSSTYSPADTQGIHRIFYARVCVDDQDMIRGRSSLTTPPGKFTVATDNTSSPKMYVVFNIDQSYPAYLLEWS